MKVMWFLHCVVHFKLHFYSCRSFSFNVTWLEKVHHYICQESTREALKCPLNGNGTPEANRQTYLAFLQNVNSFRGADGLLMELKFGDDVDVDCLRRNHGSWRKYCHLKWSLSKLKKPHERTDWKRGGDPHRNAGNTSLSLKNDRSVYSV